MNKVNVEIWSDFACPWCWIAKRRFERAVRALEGRVEVSVRQRAYRLAKDVGPISFIRALEHKTGSYAGAQRMMTAIQHAAQSEGLVYNFEAMRFGDTALAHSLVKSFAEPTARAKLVELLFKASTTDGVDIFDPDALLALATQAGIAQDSSIFNSVALQAEIAADEQVANSIANGVPLFVMNQARHLSGAQDSEIFERALLQASQVMPESFVLEDGAACGIDGCR